MTAGVHQVLAGVARRDAISNHALAAQQVIRQMGLRSEIFVDAAHIGPELAERVHAHYDWDLAAHPGDLAILHYSIDSPAFEYVLQRARASALHYHNVTPPELLWRDMPHLAAQCRDGREHLAKLTGRIVCSAADSSFNAREMEAVGLPAAMVVGILRQPLAIPHIIREPTGPIRILFVGRGVPNKCQHDLILALGALIESGTDAQLRLVGSWGGSRAYLERCRRLIRGLGLDDDVVILDSLEDSDLAEEYATADVFVCLSAHEGYCVPLLEAMSAALPIVAFDAGAVAETLGSAGLLLDDKAPSIVAEAVVALHGGALAAQMSTGRAAQAAHHSAEATSARLRSFVEDFAQC
jgi:glycosyltransferase involved in cell wall biosynthesis